jgi:hypothetical protein
VVAFFGFVHASTVTGVEVANVRHDDTLARETLSQTLNFRGISSQRYNAAMKARFHLRQARGEKLRMLKREVDIADRGEDAVKALVVPHVRDVSIPKRTSAMPAS